MNDLAERIELESKFSGDFSWAQTSPQQLLCLGRNIRRDHRGTTRCARRVERGHTSGAVPIDAPNNAILRDAEGSHDVHQATSPLADQLSGKHLESAAVILDVLEHRLNAAEVDPLAIFVWNTDRIADARGTVGDERQ